MADIRLAKPAAGTTQTVPSAPDGRFIFDFPADAATLTRSGDNLVLTFEDGASIQLQGFYTTYSKEEMPSFQVDGVEISGQDFFAALGEDLMPAAGPAASSSAARGGRYNEYGGSDLLDGIDHLGRLDVGFDGGVQLATDTVEPSPWYEGDGRVDHGVTVTPLDSDAAAEVVTVHESGLANGTTPGAADAPVSAGGSLIINAPDGVASIVIGNVTVFENGALTGNTVSTDEGTLTVTGYDPATGRLDFNYTLDRNTTEHDKSDPATDTQISHDLTVTVTDTDGDSGSTTITVNVVDDGPKINLTGASSGLLVDETFGSNGSQDVNDGGTGTATLDASRLFDVDGGADGVADMSYSLTPSQQPNDLTAIVDGQEYNVTFAVFNGQVHAMAGNTGKDIFTVSINEDTGEVTLQLTGKGSLKHPTSSNDDEILNNIIDDINVKLTVTDNDGDVTSSEVQLEIQVEDDAVQVTSAGEPKLELDESDLHGTGVQDVVNVSNNFTVVASADGEAGRSYELTLDPGAENPLVAFVGGEMMPVILSINNEGRIVGMAGDTEIFNVHVDSNGNVTFTLENNGTLVHPDNSDPDDVLSLNGIGVKLTVTDGDGDSSSAEIALDLTIRDDGPVARADNVTLTEAQAHAGASGENVLTNDVFGADAPEGKVVTSIDGGTLGQPVSGDHGTLTLNADGTYTYQLTPGVDVPKGTSWTEEFTYTIKDSDGDTSEATLTITIKGDENVPVVTVETPGAGDANIMVDEGALQAGSGQHAEHGASGSDSFTVNLNGEDGVITVGGENGWTVTVTGDSAKVTGSVVTVNGVAVTVTEATQAADGTWTVNYSYELGGDQQHETPADGNYHTDELTGEIAISVTDATGDTAEGTLTVEVHDDGPTITASDMSTTLVPGGGAGNLENGEKATFTDKNDAGHIIAQGSKLDGWDGVAMYAGKVTYTTDAVGNTIIREDGLDTPDGYRLQYSTYPTEEKPSSDWGLMVSSPDDAQEWEINVSKNGQTSEAVIFDLGGQLAYGVTIDFGAFYNGKPGAEGTTQWDHVSEKALVTFYRDGEIVGSTIVEGNSSTGTFTLNSSDVVLGGFDKVVISAVDNRTAEYMDEHSDFTIQGIDFITKRDDPIIINEGKVTAESGADGFADDYQDANVKFDLGSMVNDLSEDGTSGTITVLVNGEEHTVDVKLSEGASGESILTGTIQGGDQLFTATLDKDGNWTMEQYEQFRVPGKGDAGSSNEFDLVFKTEDADGDISSTTVNVPLEVVDQTINADNEAVSNGNDTIVITGGDGVAGTVAAGDTGGMTEGQQVEANYNVCFVLDTSGSMDEKIGGNGADRKESRLEVAVRSIENFVDTSIHNGDFVGTVNLAVVPFESEYGDTIEVSITRVSDGQGGYTETYTLGNQSYNTYTDFSTDFSKQLGNLRAEGGTNYQAGLHRAAKWFGELDDPSGADGNITYFLSDGEPTFHGTNIQGGGDHATKKDVQGAWAGYQELLGIASGMQVNAIGFGNLDGDAMKTLAMLDNTGTIVSGVAGDQAADGFLYFDDGKWSPSGTKQDYVEYESTPQRWDGTTYYTQLGDGSYQQLQWKNFGSFLNPDYRLGYYTGGRWHEVKDSFYTIEEIPLIATGGNATQVTNGEGLTAAFKNGFKPGTLAAAGDDSITAENSTSSVIVYGDVMNTDRLRYELLQIANGEATLIAVLPGYGAGMELFQWLEKHGTDPALKDTKFEGWTREDSIKYMLEHADELGYETRVDTDGNPYLVAPDGSVWNVDGSKANVDLDSLTGRTGGNDSTTGSEGDDIFFGQEGEDQLFGAAGDDTLYGGTGDDLLVGDARPESLTADTLEEIKTLGTGDALDAFIDSVEGTDADGNDQLFGGAGNDVLLGMGGDDYLDGGAGEDATFGGGGNDIIVYDKADYLVSGGSGIDFMVSTDSQLTMEALLGGTGDGNGPIVDGIEVLLKGKDALSLTSLDQLAKEYGITLDTNDEGNETLILDMDKWTYDKENGVYTSKEGDLTLETNLTPVEASDPASEAVQQQVFTLEHSNG